MIFSVLGSAVKSPFGLILFNIVVSDHRGFINNSFFDPPCSEDAPSLTVRSESGQRLGPEAHDWQHLIPVPRHAVVSAPTVGARRPYRLSHIDKALAYGRHRVLVQCRAVLSVTEEDRRP